MPAMAMRTAIIGAALLMAAALAPACAETLRFKADLLPVRPAARPRAASSPIMTPTSKKLTWSGSYTGVGTYATSASFYGAPTGRPPRRRAYPDDRQPVPGLGHPIANAGRRPRRRRVVDRHSHGRIPEGRAARQARARKLASIPASGNSRSSRPTLRRRTLRASAIRRRPPMRQTAPTCQPDEKRRTDVLRQLRMRHGPHDAALQPLQLPDSGNRRALEHRHYLLLRPVRPSEPTRGLRTAAAAGTPRSCGSPRRPARLCSTPRRRPRHRPSRSRRCRSLSSPIRSLQNSASQFPRSNSVRFLSTLTTASAGCPETNAISALSVSAPPWPISISSPNGGMTRFSISVDRLRETRRSACAPIARASVAGRAAPSPRACPPGSSRWSRC